MVALYKLIFAVQKVTKKKLEVI